MEYFEKASWTEAESLCEKKGAHLWVINNHEEWSFVRNDLRLYLFEKRERLAFSHFMTHRTPIMFIGLKDVSLIKCV